MTEAYYGPLTGLVLVGSLYKPVWTQTQRHPRASALQVLRLKEHTTIFILKCFYNGPYARDISHWENTYCVQSPGFPLQCHNKYVSK